METSLEMGRRLMSLEAGHDYTFDFTNLKFVGPFGMVYVATCIEDAGRRLLPGKLRARGHQLKSYLAHMGFFRTFGLKHGNRPGEARGSSRYIPVSEIDVKEIHREAAQSGIAIGEFVEERAQQIAAVLSQQVEGNLHDTLAFAIREILRNAVEHSQSPKVRYCAQYWPNSDRVEVAILDHGRGVHQSLKVNPYIKCKTDREALHYALMPGISGTAFKGSKISGKGVWQNSGFGLYMTNRICRMGGDFFIGSHKSSLFLKPSVKQTFEFDFPGTVLRLSIRPSEATNLRSRLLLFSEEGRKIAENLKGAVIEASTASQMLTVDYRQ